MLAITGGLLLMPGAEGHFETREGQVLLIEGERILDILPRADYQARYSGCEELEAGGRYVSPGFINIHIHGCLGADTMDAGPEALRRMQRGLPGMGVTAFLPTTMTCPTAHIRRALENIRACKASQQPEQGAAILGANLEGPFISPAHRGSQAEENIRRADFALLEPYAGLIRYVTIAPEELQGDYSFVEKCLEAGIRVSLGHTSASYAEAAGAYAHGVRHATHLYNAMTPFHHREPGAVGAVLDLGFCAELIADGVHAHEAAQRLAWRLKGERQELILITDSLRACGLGDGESELGGQKVYVKNQVARLADGTIAASVASMDHVVRTFAESTGAGLPRTVELVTRVPAEELGCADERGTLRPGSLADITIFDEGTKIFATFVRGTLAYRN